jgi:7-carboxy-7-deazaguanine synthase
MVTKYYINELFTSIDGEINPWHQGHPSFFIRMQGCNLKCSYCDTQKSQPQHKGKKLSLSEVYSQYTLHGAPNKITITGGEPLLQNITHLVEQFLEESVLISIETNGTLEQESSWVHSANVSLIIDIKLPSSGCSEKQIAWDWIRNMVDLPNTWLKFVVQTEHDLFSARSYISSYNLPVHKCAFSPVFGVSDALKPAQILDWLLKESLSEALLNIQLHKLIDMK